VQHNRSTQRKLVGLLVKLSHKGLDEFAAKYATNLSDGGMFIRTKEPKAVGTELSFKVEIANGLRVLQGTAVVRWTRGLQDPNGPPGMGLEFITLDAASRALVDRMLGLAPKPPPLDDEPFTMVAPTSSPSSPFAQVPVTSAPPAMPAIAPVTRAPIQPPVAPAIAPLAPQAPPPEPEPLDAELVPEAPAATRAPYEPAPVADSSDSLDVAEAPVVFGDVGAPNPQNSIEVDFDALLSGTTRPPTPPPFSSSESIPLEVEPLESADDALTGLPDVPLEVPPAPPSRAEPPAPRAPPVVQQHQAPAPAADAPPQLHPVFLKDLPPSDGTGPVIGIDLGTTNSACAVLTKGRPYILNSKDGYNTIPSVVTLTKAGTVQVGHRAKGQMVLNPTQSIFGAKRMVGREFDSPTVKQLRERSHFEIVRGEDRRAAVKLGPHTLSLEEVQGLILKECRAMAEQALGVPVSRAVVTCPAYYSEPQREAVRRAGAMAGLKVERVLNEPTAAALAYGMNRELKKTVLVYDLGGGTFDATLLKLDQNVFEVLATGGDVFLGGVDFDNQIVDLLLERFQQWHKRPFSGDRVALSRMAEVAEKAKMALSERATFDVSLPMLEMDGQGKPLDLRTTLTRADVEAVTTELIDRTIQAVQDVLLDAKLKPSQVDDIILVGGMSRMPLVREKLKALFKKPPHASVNADEAVALGAALYSGTVDKVSSLVLIDVVPMTIGLGRPGGQFHRLIERNTALPATRSFAISTQKDNQTELEVMVFQGEDSNVAGNEFLGAVTITGLPKAPKGAVQVAVTLGLDAECVLRVEAREFKTRTVVRATLATRYTTEEIAQRLGITAEKSAAVNKSRGDELEKRAGGFWNKLKGLFGR